MVTWQEVGFYAPRLLVGGFVYAIMIAAGVLAVGGTGALGAQFKLGDSVYDAMGGQGQTPRWADGAAGALLAIPVTIVFYNAFRWMYQRVEGRD